jgi:hypothetical protein
MDPLSATASIIAVLQTASAVISVCYNYRSNVKNSSSQQSKVLEEVKSLRNTLEALEPLVRDAENTGLDDNGRLQQRINEPLAGCLLELEHLHNILELPSWGGRDGSRRQALMKALTWPLNEGDAKKALDNIGRFKATLNLALTTNQTRILQSSHKEITKTREGINAQSLSKTRT